MNLADEKLTFLGTRLAHARKRTYEPNVCIMLIKKHVTQNGDYLLKNLKIILVESFSFIQKAPNFSRIKCKNQNTHTRLITHTAMPINNSHYMHQVNFMEPSAMKVEML